ncbi:hypothetical protein ACWEKR_29535 [Nocardia sp. NPDC004573]
MALHAWSDTSGPDVPVRAWEEARESAEAVLAASLAGWSERYPDVPVRRIVIAARHRAGIDQQCAAALDRCADDRGPFEMTTGPSVAESRSRPSPSGTDLSYLCG